MIKNKTKMLKGIIKKIYIHVNLKLTSFSVLPGLKPVSSNSDVLVACHVCCDVGWVYYVSESDVE